MGLNTKKEKPLFCVCGFSFEGIRIRIICMCFLCFFVKQKKNKKKKIEKSEFELFVKRGVILLQLRPEFPSMRKRGCTQPSLIIKRIGDTSNLKRVKVLQIFLFFFPFLFCFFLIF